MAFTSPYTVVLATVFLLYAVALPIYRYFKDEKGLRRFPNMMPLSGISNIPFMYISHGGFRSKYLVERHRKHPVIRIGPNTLSYSNPLAIKEIYGHSTKCIKDHSYVLMAGSHYHLADVIDKPDHARKRKILSSAYAIKNLEGWEHKVADKTRRLILHLDKCCTAPLEPGKVPSAEDLNVDYRSWTNFFTLDAIADIGLSQTLGFLDSGHDQITGQRLDGSTYKCNFRDSLYGNARKQSLLLWSYSWYFITNKISNLIPFYSRLEKCAQDWDGIPLFLAHRRLKRYQAGEKLDDFFQALMEDKNHNPNFLEWGEIVAEISVMMNAGSTTTSIAMTNVLYQLLKNPQKMKNLVEELDNDLSSEADNEDPVIAYDKVKHLPYLRACLDESLRIFPPTTHNLPRETPPEGTTILGEFIPGGTSVGMSALAAHRDESVFPNAEQYIPERWLGEPGKNLQPYFIAFSAGARGCIGRNISYLEQTVLLASILRRFEFSLPSPDWKLERIEYMNLLLGPMPIKVWRRPMKAQLLPT